MSEKLIENASEEMHPIFKIPMRKMPRHVAIIMDGNGRWAQEKGLPRIEGHRNGSKGVRSVITQSAQLGFECLSLYSFSTENWKRPKHEVDTLMGLYKQYLIEERPTIMGNNIKLRHIGFEEGLPDDVIKELRETSRMSANNTGMTLFLALNYSGRAEIVGTVQRIAQKVKQGEISVEDIDESVVDHHLDTGGAPDPDLLIRTSGEKRISNFLLWQIAYAELYVTDIHWPDFGEETLTHAVQDFAQRNRRFGDINSKK